MSNGGILGQPNIPSSIAANGRWTPNEVNRQLVGGSRGLYWPTLVDANFANVSFLCHFNDPTGQQFVDKSANANISIYMVGGNFAGGVGLTTTAKFGQTALADGFTAGGGIRVVSGVSSCFVLGTGDFTIESWIYRTASSGVIMIFIDFRTNSATETNPLMGIDTSNHLTMYHNGTTPNITGSTLVTTNTWHHVHLTRASGTSYLGLDGAQEGSDYTDANNYIGNTLCLMNQTAANAGLIGAIDEVRITKGFARYARTYTVPTEPFPDY